MAQQQVQSKDMPPRFSKKGQLNADEVTELVYVKYPALTCRCCIFVPSDYKKTRYSEEYSLVPVRLLPFTLSLPLSVSSGPLHSVSSSLKLVPGPLTAIMRYEGMN